ncbi:MAG: phosphotransferase [Dermatophilaceae bacterium]
MTRSPLFLAALASSAVPGLDPVSVEALRTRPGELYEVAYLQDSQDRRWVIKAPLTPAAGAMLEDVTTLMALVGRRLAVAIPVVRGQVVVPEGRAVVYLRLAGRPIDFRALGSGPGLAAEVGRTLAHIHNLDLAILDEAGRPSYDAETHRVRQLSELDRAAATGHIPTGLLGRWERALEDVSHWRFAPTAVHGNFVGSNVLASISDTGGTGDTGDTQGAGDAATARVRGVLAWEESRIGDPADDLAALVAEAPPAALDVALEAYAQSRVERPDPHLLTRARLAAEMSVIRRLLSALSAGDLPRVDEAAEFLRELDEFTYAEEERRARQAKERRDTEETERASAHEEAERAAAADPGDAWDATQAHDSAGAAAPPPVIDSDLTQPHNTFAAAQPDDPAPVPESTSTPQESDPRESDGQDVETEPAVDEDEFDLHEGASDFVPVERPQPPPPNA